MGNTHGARHARRHHWGRLRRHPGPPALPGMLASRRGTWLPEESPPSHRHGNPAGTPPARNQPKSVVGDPASHRDVSRTASDEMPGAACETGGSTGSRAGCRHVGNPAISPAKGKKGASQPTRAPRSGPKHPCLAAPAGCASIPGSLSAKGLKDLAHGSHAARPTASVAGWIAPLASRDGEKPFPRLHGHMAWKERRWKPSATGRKPSGFTQSHQTYKNGSGK